MKYVFRDKSEVFAAFYNLLYGYQNYITKQMPYSWKKDKRKEFSLEKYKPNVFFFIVVTSVDTS